MKYVNLNLFPPASKKGLRSELHSNSYHYQLRNQSGPNKESVANFLLQFGET